MHPALPLIQESVKAAFYDESWPVRDRALVCLSVIAGRFGCDDEDVWQLMWGNLCDQIWSVRDNAGWGIGEWLKGMPEGAERDKKLGETKANFEELTGKAKEEPKRTRKDVQNEVRVRDIQHLKSILLLTSHLGTLPTDQRQGRPH